MIYNFFRFVVFLIFICTTSFLYLLLSINQKKIRCKYSVDLLFPYIFLYLISFFVDYYCFDFFPYHIIPLLHTFISIIIIIKTYHIQIIGLTGGIACGKSTASDIIHKSFDIEIIDCDLLSRKIVEIGKPAYLKIVQVFSEQILMDSKEIDRKKLGEKIFADRILRGKLTRITGYYIMIEIIKEIYRIFIKEKKSFAVLDAPLLFESKYLEYICYPIIVIYVTEEKVQIERIQKRDGLTEEQALNRIRSQWKIELKIKKGDILINNEMSIEEMETNLKKELSIRLI